MNCLLSLISIDYLLVDGKDFSILWEEKGCGNNDIILFRIKQGSKHIRMEQGSLANAVDRQSRMQKKRIITDDGDSQRSPTRGLSSITVIVCRYRRVSRCFLGRLTTTAKGPRHWRCSEQSLEKNLYSETSEGSILITWCLLFLSMCYFQWATIEQRSSFMEGAMAINLRLICWTIFTDLTGQNQVVSESVPWSIEEVWLRFSWSHRNLLTSDRSIVNAPQVFHVFNRIQLVHMLMLLCNIG